MKMNFTSNGAGDEKDPKFDLRKKNTALNPYAAAFVPSSLKVKDGSSCSIATRFDVPGSSKRAVLDRAVSNMSNISDNGINQYWRNQPSDDITPVFNVVKKEMGKLENHSFASLSLHGNSETSRSVTSVPSQIWGRRQDMPATVGDSFSLEGKKGYSGSTFSEPHQATTLMTSTISPWGKSLANGETDYSNGSGGHHDNEDYIARLPNVFPIENADPENSIINQIERSTSQCPDFSAQRLADVNYGNGCDQLHFDGYFNQNHGTKPTVARGLSLLDSSTLLSADSSNRHSKYSGADDQFTPNKYRSLPYMLKGEIDFASTVEKRASHYSGQRGNKSHSIPAGAGIGSSRNSQSLASSCYGHGKMINRDMLQQSDESGANPIWLETGEAIGNMHSKTREEAHDLARLRTACFEPVDEAYIFGNKTLAKDLHVRDQSYNMQMEVAHESAKEVAFRLRNPLSAGLQDFSRGHAPVIDLSGFHISKAMNVLNQELGILRSTSRYTGQLLQVMVWVGTVHQTKCSGSHARLPVAIEQYLLDEGFHYAQPHPGLFCVVI